MPGTTAFPAALDTFPSIDASTQENAPGLEHDVLHSNDMAALAALQVKVGIDASADPDSLDARIGVLELEADDLADQVADKLDASAVGVDVAPLVGGKVPTANLPSYVDDVLEFANLAAFPGTGESGKIYIAIDTASQYRWSGSAYVQLVASPGTTDALTEGSTNFYFTPERAQDAIAALIAAGTHVGITFSYDDAGNAISATVTGGGGGSSDARDSWLLG